MSSKRLRKRVPSARKFCVAKLPGYKMICNKRSIDGSGKGNIIPGRNPVDNVWGVIYEISDHHKAQLDATEGLGKGYYETLMEFVTDENKVFKAQTYIAKSSVVDNKLIPYDWYKAFILEGAKENNLPEGYIEALEKIDFTTDHNAKRRKENYAVINIDS